MSGNNVQTLSYYLDLVLKGSVAVCIAIAGWFFQTLQEKVNAIEGREYASEKQIAVHENVLMMLSKQLERIERKLDAMGNQS